MKAYYLGRVAYRPTWELQERLRTQVLAGGPETLLLCEHLPVLTLGKSATPTDILLATDGVEQVRTSRGGQVTYHGPGQLVVYPIVRLRGGVLAHIEWLARAAIAVASRFGIAAEFSRERVGVWTHGRKLAAIGVHIARRVAIHGLAMNIRREATRAFEQGWFVACGEAGARAVSLEEAVPESHPARPFALTVESAAQLMADELSILAGHVPLPLETATLEQLGAPRSDGAPTEPQP